MNVSSQKLSNKNNRFTNVIEKLYGQRFICSLLICFIVSFITAAVSGFRFTYFSNDDYLLSLLISKGETHSLYVNFFLVNAIGFFQKLIPFLNWFALFQQIFCFVAMVALVYAFLKKLPPLFGVPVSVALSLLIFISNILQIQYSQTAVLLCAAGTVLLAHAQLLESRKGFKILQTVVSFLLIIVGSLFRFIPFAVCAAFSFIFVFCILYAKFKASPKIIFKKRMALARRECLPFVLTFVIAFGVSAALYIAADTIDRADPNYSRYIEYNDARMLVDDYESAPFKGNEEFYKSVGINSEAELVHFVYDTERYNATVLKSISEYSEKVVQSGDPKPVYAMKKSFHQLPFNVSVAVETIKGALGLSVDSTLLGVILLFTVLAILFICGFFAVRFIKRSQIKIEPKNAALTAVIAVIWVWFMLIASVDPYNFLFVLLAAVVLCTLIIDKTHNYVACILFSLAPMALHLYQNPFRMSLRVSYAFVLPSVIFLLYLLEPREVKPLGAKPRYRTVGIFTALLTLVIGFAVPSVLIHHGYYHDNYFDHDMSLREYVEQHDDSVFFARILSCAYLDPCYYDCTRVPSVADNEVILGWYESSDYFENTLKDKHIDNNYMLDLIDSDNRLIIEDNGTYTFEERQQTYEDFYRYHYFNGEPKVKLVLEKKYTYPITYSTGTKVTKNVGVFKVVTVPEKQK